MEPKLLLLDPRQHPRKCQDGCHEHRPEPDMQHVLVEVRLRGGCHGGEC